VTVFSYPLKKTRWTAVHKHS